MAQRSIIPGVTEEILNRLRDGLCPDIIHDRESVGASNDTGSVNFILNLYLYNISKADGTLLNMPHERFTALTLEYMLSAQSTGVQGAAAFTEQTVLSEAADILGGSPFIYLKNHMPISIELNDLSLYDKNTVSPKRPALFYSVCPVLIYHTKEKPAPRVLEIR